MKAKSAMFRAILTICTAILAISAAQCIVPRPSVWPKINTQAVWANGKVYYVGGTAPATLQDAAGKVYLSDRNAGFSIYDPSSNSWSSSNGDGTGPLGMDTDGDGICSEGGMCGEGTFPGTSQTFTYDIDYDGVDEIFIHAGSKGWDGCFWCYDPNAAPRGTWSKVGSVDVDLWSPGNSGYFMAQYFGVAALHEDTVYCYGGEMWGPNTRRSFARYNLSTDIWTVLPDGPVPIFGGVGAVINGKLYITGGTQQTSYASGIWEFDVVSEQWQNDTSGNPAPVAHLVKGVEKPGVAVYNNRMYIIGGTSSTGDVKTIQVFDPASKTVTTVGELPEVMTRHGATISPDGILYVGGGRQNGVDATAWWKADLKVTPLNFTRLPDDPACFPYEDWSVGYSISGQVTDPNGAPVASAIIGIKESPNAAADPIKYAVTDSSGNFGQVQLEAGTYYVAAWKEGWTPTPDVVVSLTNEGNMVVDLQFTKPAGANIAAGTTSDKVWASSWDNSNYVPVNAVDGNIATRWSSMNGASQPHVFIVDLRDSANNDRFIDGVTIFWYTGRPAAYQVDVMSGGDPMSFGLWDNPQGSPGTAVTTVYTASNKAGCFIGAERYVSPIRFEAPVKASGLRIVMNGFTDYPGLYGIWELQVHAADGAQTIGRLSDAKALPAGASIVVSGVHLTALPGNGMPSQVAYVEDSDRSCGLRLHLNDVDLSASVGSTVEIEGTVAFTEHDEMYLSVKSVSVIDPTLDPLKPLGMNGRFASQKIAQGLLVKLWGMVISKGAGWFVLEDGSGAAIKVYSTAAVSQGSFVSLKGIISRDSSGVILYMTEPAVE